MPKSNTITFSVNETLHQATIPMTTVNYLKTIADVGRSCGSNLNGYSCLEDFILKNGAEWERIETPRKYPRGIPQACFHNAQLLCMDNPELTYCEGYAIGAIIPVLHAWVLTPNGEAIDNTWSKDHLKSATQYVGVAMQLKYIIGELVKTRRHISLIDDYEHRFPILTAQRLRWEHPLNVKQRAKNGELI